MSIPGGADKEPGAFNERRVRRSVDDGDVARELDEELAFHLDAVTEDLVADGWEPEAARAEARRRFGDLEGTRRYCRSVGRRQARRERRKARLGAWLLDLRFALRQLGRSPGFSFAVLATLTLGIGAVTGILALVQGVLLRPLPYPQPDRLVRVWDTSTRMEGWDRVNVNPANFRDWQERTTVFAGLAGFAAAEVTLRTESGAERVPATWITAGLLEVLGTVPVLGREPLPAEDRPGAEAPVAVLSHETWTTRYGADPDVLGRTVDLEGRSHEIIGVAPPELRLPGVVPARQPDYLLPGGFGEPNGRGGHWLRAVARLGDGVTLERARDEMDAVAAGLEAEHPETNEGLRVRLEPLHESEVGESRGALLLFLGAVGLLLLIACANVAALFLIRNLQRAREFGVRAALGAGRGRVLRQLLVETLLVAGLGTLGGGAVAVGLTALAPSLPAVDLPRLDTVRVDGWVLALAAGVSLLASLLAVFVPAVVALRRDPAAALRGGTGRGATSRSRAGEVLAVVEVTLSVVLLAGAALLARSYLELSGVDPGFDPEGVAVVRVVVPEDVYDDGERAALYPRLLERVRALPGVSAAGAGDSPPFQTAQNSRTSYRPDDRPPPAPEEPPLMAWEEYATPGYFEALGIPLLAGRTFRGADRADAPPVAVVNRAFAETTWPGEEAVGKRFSYNGRSWEVVGVVGSTRREGLDAQVGPEMFFPPSQHPSWVPSAVFLTVRVSGDPAAVVEPVRDVVRQLAPDVPVGLAATMESLVAGTLAPARFRWMLVGTFAGAALGLALLGVYAVLSYGVTLRRREMGVRMALGADRGSVRDMVLRRGLLLTAVGLVLGLMAWLGASGALAGLLYGVRPLDPVTLALVVALFLAAGGCAAYLPARRATRLDPVRTLREEG